MKRKIFSLAIVSISILFTVGGLLAVPQEVLGKDAKSIKKAPDFTLTDIHGKTLSLSQLKGKIVLIDFWATWCPFCRTSIPILMSLYNEYKDKGVEVVGIALENDGGKALKRFAKEKKITYPLLIGNQKLAREYSVYGVPTRFLIDRKGNIVEKFIGTHDKKSFESAIKKLL